MQPVNFLHEYEARTDEELLRLSLESDQLTDDANQALSIVMRNRGIATEERKREFQQEEARAEGERANNIGHLAVFHPLGIGRERYSKFDHQFDRASGMEQFITTIFIVIFWLPLVPIGTYRIERKRRFLFSSKMTVLERLPLNWTQVLAVWAVASLILLAGYWTLLLFVSTRHPAH
ncbi:MAG: hypothetical protein WA700_00215 [Acidobacteriaceae bacterium]